MISKDKMFPLLLEACPTFAPEWESFVEEWTGKGELPLYLALADLARHLVAKLEAGDTACLLTVFTAVERLIVEGDDYVREAAIIGLLEDVQNSNLHRTTEPEQFRPFLHAQSERFWDKLYDFWSAGKAITDD